jgi:hypothetical protein
MLHVDQAREELVVLPNNRGRRAWLHGLLHVRLGNVIVPTDRSPPFTVEGRLINLTALVLPPLGHVLVGRRHRHSFAS